MSKSSVTIQDCLDMESMKDMRVVLNDGKVIGFKKERSSRNTDQSTPRANTQNNIRYAIYSMVAHGKQSVKEGKRDESLIEHFRSILGTHQPKPNPCGK